MKIHSIHLQGVGPLKDWSVVLKQDWQDGIENLVLLSGSNGCGKSTILRTIAHLWKAFGLWLNQPEGRPHHTDPTIKWLRKWTSSAMILHEMPSTPVIGLFMGETAEFKKLKSRYPEVYWVGESWGDNGSIRRDFRVILHRNDHIFSSLSEDRLKLLHTRESPLSNFVYLDGEERRWVAPKRSMKSVVSDAPDLNWLASYQATENWEGQLESSLITFKTLDPDGYFRIIDDLNRFLHGKKIDPHPDPRYLRLRVYPQVGDYRVSYFLDDLSSGEKQVLIQLYMVSRWMQPKGIVMIDEPDLHLHPSLLSVFLSNLERIVQKKGGQMILTSHSPELWRRYENHGLRIELNSSEE